MSEQVEPAATPAGTPGGTPRPGWTWARAERLLRRARTWVLAEFLLVASFVTLVLAGLRAGVPDAAELTALLCTWVVVVLQVVSSAMRWSSRPGSRGGSC